MTVACMFARMCYRGFQIMMLGRLSERSPIQWPMPMRLCTCICPASCLHSHAAAAPSYSTFHSWIWIHVSYGRTLAYGRSFAADLDFERGMVEQAVLRANDTPGLAAAVVCTSERWYVVSPVKPKWRGPQGSREPLHIYHQARTEGPGPSDVFSCFATPDVLAPG